MKVNYIKKINGNEQTINSLTEKKEYEVIAMAINMSNSKVMYNVVDDFNRLAFYESSFFEILLSNIDIDWVFKPISENYFVLMPEVLSYKSFYEDFHNDHPEARAKFKKRFPNYDVI